MHLTADTMNVNTKVTVGRYLERTEQTQNARLLIKQNSNFRQYNAHTHEIQKKIEDASHEI